MTIAITRQELGADGLRREAARCRDAKAARRMLALALVLEGSSREEAARHAGMDRQTLRAWVRRFNSLPSGLTGGPRASPACTTGGARGASRASPRSKGPSWRRSWSGGRTRTGTAWCAGGGATSRP